MFMRMLHPVILVNEISVCKMFMRMRMLHTPNIIDNNKVCEMFMRMSHPSSKY
jgi:hypothetical protein